MAQSTVSSGNVVTRFKKDVIREYVREGCYGPYIGKTSNAMIQVNNDLKKVSIPLVAKLSGNGVSGSSQLAGNEEALSNYDFVLTPTYKRHGVLVDNEENEKSEFSLLQEARPALMNWAMELKRDEITQALCSVPAGTTYVNYGDASATQLDTWNTNNTDRILYGSAKSNLTAGNHTTSLATIDTTNDKLDPAMISLMKRMCQQANPIIRPIMVKSDEPWYVFFCGTYGFRDLREDSTMQQAQREAWARGKDNPLFSGGDLLWDGVIIKELRDLDKFIDGDSTGSAFDGVLGANATSGDGLDDGGNGSSRVGIGFMCGAQAVGFGLGRMPSMKRRKEDDYEHLNGVGISMKHDIKKTFFNSKQHGVLTSFHSAAADS